MNDYRIQNVVRKTDHHATARQRKHFFQKGKMITRFGVQQIGSANVKVIVRATPLKFVADTRVQKRVAGRRCFELGDAILSVHPPAFDAGSPMFALIIERNAITERRDARQWFAAIGILRVDVVGLYPQIKIIGIFLDGYFAFRDDILDRFGSDGSLALVISNGSR